VSACHSRLHGRGGSLVSDNLGSAQSKGQNLVVGQSKQASKSFLSLESLSLFDTTFPDRSNRWTSEHCLHVSASSPAPIVDAPTALAQSTSDSYIETQPPPTPSSSFTTAYAMLLYNVCYLAYTQAVEIPLSQAGDVLLNLCAVCCSADLGRSAFPSCPYANEALIIHAVVLTKHTRYFSRPRRPASPWILHSYSRPPPPLQHRGHARRDHALWGHTRTGATYLRKTSGTCWTMPKQVPPSSPSTSTFPSCIAFSLLLSPPFVHLSIVAYLRTHVPSTLPFAHPSYLYNSVTRFLVCCSRNYGDGVTEADKNYYRG
jgi:hypothetical protein